MSEDDTFKSFRYPPLSTALATNHIPNLERAVAFKSDFRLKPPSPPPLEELESESVTVIYEIKRILPVQQPVPKKIEVLRNTIIELPALRNRTRRRRKYVFVPNSNQGVQSH
ncbi:uncharacterized protein LOC121379042 isoform X2 [Gigantopelta aegis]|uniref:uncharacterized protein LOC121379042 isoform X2 n=1 Tax=Gigantopelta aegis TaxID=1735272 RepID=UPI001B88B404|nr:uncharacterized protein LOC121379042 isoform X2 [Gigantopelta aegis]